MSDDRILHLNIELDAIAKFTLPIKHGKHKTRKIAIESLKINKRTNKLGDNYKELVDCGDTST